MAAPWRRLALAVAFCSLLAARAAQATSGGYPLAMVQAAPVAFTEEEPEDLDATKEQDRERSTDIVNSEPGSDRASVSASLGDAGESQSEDRGQESNVSMGCAAVVATFTNCWGQDIGISWPVANVEECCGYCAGDSNCTAWTVDSRSVVDEPGTQGRCWLKSSCSDRRDDSLAISGFMAVDSVKTSDRVKAGGILHHRPPAASRAQQALRARPPLRVPRPPP
ncbi:unnamed protein product [Prorocentrum cordatum]|uniref:Apple domain-containing protein n=1 Tax=Prorocentrum cordatum TaxID=2364126 RepID=A0ABN9W6Y4_9DINO|nr:unnamed protein product [Polarella glacialis]